MQTNGDWVSYVLSDIVDFLVENGRLDSAKMLAVAAAHIDHDLRRGNPAPQTARGADTKALTLPGRKRRLN